MARVGGETIEFRKMFGKVLRACMRAERISPIEMAYILDVTYPCIFAWLKGKSFPGNLILKKMMFVLGDMEMMLEGITRHPSLAPSSARSAELSRALKAAARPHHAAGKLRASREKSRRVDRRCASHCREFGEHLRARRDRLGISGASLASALGVTHGNLLRWEGGLSFPQDFETLGLLEELVGGVMDRRFMLGRFRGSITLSRRERDFLMRRMSQIALHREESGQERRAHHSFEEWERHHKGIHEYMSRYKARARKSKRRLAKKG